MKTLNHFDSLLTNKKINHQVIKCRLKAGNSYYYSVQLLCLADFKIYVHKTTILPVVLYGCETGSLKGEMQANSSWEKKDPEAGIGVQEG